VFWVRDYGSGLSEDDVLSLYTTYFRSTKDQDNSQIGGFGLGSKSPFAVADQFTVTSWHGGFKSTYACFRQDGMPHVNAVGKEPCGPETGLEVRVPLTARSGTVLNWEAQARTLFCWWPETPTFNSGFTVDQGLFMPDNLLLTSDNAVDGAPDWVVFRHVHQNTLVMGNVPYALNQSAITGLPDPVVQLLDKIRLAIRVPMGSVSISPSRETLSYDAATNKYLVDRLVQVGREITAKLEKEVSTCPTLAAARERVHGAGDNSLSQLFGRLKDAVKPRWNGKPVPETVSFKLDTAFSKPAQAFEYNRPGRRSTFLKDVYGAGDSFEHRIPKYDGTLNQLLWSEKGGPAAYRKLRHHYPAGNKRIDVRLQVVTGIPYQELASKCVEIGMPVPINIDADLEAPPPAAAGSRSTAPKTQGYVFDPATFSYSRTTGTLDLTGGGVYFEFEKGEPRRSYYNALQVLRQMGFFTLVTPPRIIGLAKSNLDRLKNKKLMAALDTHGWVRFDSAWVHANVTKDFIEGHHRSGAILQWLGQTTSPSRKLLEAGSWKGMEDMVKAVRPYLSLPFTYTKYGSHDDLYAMLSTEQLQAKQRGLAVGRQLEATWQKFLDRHPMLRYADMQRIPLDTLNDYVNR